MSFELINFYNNLRITTEELLSIIPEDEQERKYFFVHMSVFDTFKFVGLLTKICSQLNFINYAKIQYEMKLDDFFMERKIDAPLIKLYEQLELYSITVNNKSRREYNSDVMNYIEEVKKFDKNVKDLELLENFKIEELVTLFKKHNDIRTFIQRQLTVLIGSCFAIINSYAKYKMDDVVIFYTLVKEEFEIYAKNYCDKDAIENKLYNMFFVSQKGQDAILHNESEEPTTRDWGELLNRLLDSYRSDNLLYGLIKTNNRRKFYEIDNDDILDWLYYNCEDKCDLDIFFEELIKLNFVKNKILQGKKHTESSPIAQPLNFNFPVTQVIAHADNVNINDKKDKEE